MSRGYIDESGDGEDPTYLLAYSWVQRLGNTAPVDLAVFGPGGSLWTPIAAPPKPWSVEFELMPGKPVGFALLSLWVKRRRAPTAKAPPERRDP